MARLEEDKRMEYMKDLRVPERIEDDQCDYCRAPAGCPHHPDCPEKEE